MPGSPSLSVVIPTLNAGRALPRTLEALDRGDEVLVVDGGSSDDTLAIARRWGARIVTAQRGRGPQLAAGAAAASGTWLLFLHADTIPAPEWRAAVGAFVANPSNLDKAACFRFELDDASWPARVLERAVALRVGWLHLPYGDQGLLIHRDLLVELGGYQPLPLMEDVDLVCRIGWRRLVCLDHAARTSAERWLRHGWLRRSSRNALCLTLFFLGVPPDLIGRLYG